VKFVVGGQRTPGNFPFLLHALIEHAKSFVRIYQAGIYDSRRRSLGKLLSMK
jgi:hypothetical protein